MKHLDQEKVCMGCGHLESDPVQKPAMACCPDSNYIPLREYLKRSQIVDRKATEKRLDAEKLIASTAGYIQGAKDYCRSSDSLDTFLVSKNLEADVKVLQTNTKKAKKWDDLSKEIEGNYINHETEECWTDEECGEKGFDLISIGEIAATAFGWLN